MREIKFRGRDTDGNWHYGDLLRYVSDSYDMIIPAGHANSDDLYDDVVCVDYDTVGQFTGLLDSNGQEIYEGDILDVDGDFLAEVVYCNGSFELYTKKETLGTLSDIAYEYTCSIFDGVEKTFSVVGNIHDNPGLLERRS